MTTTRTFEKLVKQALKHYHTPDKVLATSPLASQYTLSGVSRFPETMGSFNGKVQKSERPAGEIHSSEMHSSGMHNGELLCALLRESAEALWGEKLPTSQSGFLDRLPAIRQQPDTAQYAFAVLELRCFHTWVKPPRLAAIWEDDIYLPGSRAEHYRDFDSAIERLSTELLNRMRPTLRADSPRPPKNLVGFDGHIRACRERLQKNHSLQIVGPSGAGKSSLTAAVLQSLNEQPSFWYTIRPGFTDRVDGLLSALGYFLHSMGASGLWRQLAANGGFLDDVNLAMGIVRSDLAEQPQLQPQSQGHSQGDPQSLPILVFDDTEHLVVEHDADADAHDQLRTLIQELAALFPTVVVGQRSAVPTDAYVELTGLAAPDIITLLEAEDIALTSDEIRDLYTYTKGNPQLLSICSALLGSGISFAELVPMIDRVGALVPIVRRLWQRLSAEEQRLLQLLSIFPNPVSIDVVQEGIQLENRATVDHLIGLRLVQEDRYGGNYLVPSLRQVIHNDLSAELRDKFHLYAASALFQNGEYTRAAYHFHQGGNDLLAIQSWYPHRKAEIQRGQASAARRIFGEMSASRLRKKEQNVLRLIRGELDLLYGDIGGGLQALEAGDWPDNSLTTINQSVLRAKFQNALGYPEKAIEACGEAQRVAAHLLSTLTAVHGQAGLVAVNAGDIEKCRQESELAKCEAHHLAGLLYEMEGDFAAAEAELRVAIQFAERNDELARSARLHRYLSILFGKQQQFEEASRYADLALSYYESVGDRFNIEIMRNNLSALYVYSGQYKEAIHIGKEALGFFENIQSPSLISSTASNIAEAYFELDDLENAHHYAELALREEDPHVTPYALQMLGTCALAKEQYAPAEEYFTQVVKLAEETNDLFINAAARRSLGQLYRAQAVGDKEGGSKAEGRKVGGGKEVGGKAKAEFAEALRLFENLGIQGEIEQTKALMDAEELMDTDDKTEDTQVKA